RGSTRWRETSPSGPSRGSPRARCACPACRAASAARDPVAADHGHSPRAPPPATGRRASGQRSARGLFEIGQDRALVVRLEPGPLAVLFQKPWPLLLGEGPGIYQLVAHTALGLIEA